MLSFEKANKLSLEDLNQEINNLQESIEKHLNSSLKEKTPIDMEPLRQWSNELYALNSLRLQRASKLNSSLQNS